MSNEAIIGFGFGMMRRILQIAPTSISINLNIILNVIKKLHITNTRNSYNFSFLSRHFLQRNNFEYLMKPFSFRIRHVISVSSMLFRWDWFVGALFSWLSLFNFFKKFLHQFHFLSKQIILFYLFWIYASDYLLSLCVYLWNKLLNALRMETSMYPFEAKLKS